MAQEQVLEHEVPARAHAGKDGREQHPQQLEHAVSIAHPAPARGLAAQHLVKEFAQILRERDVDGLYAWLRVAETSDIVELQALARSIWIDRSAVEAAVRLEWSNGQVEASVNKLKLTKHAMYGRVKFDLLRRRVLQAA